jgi:DNA-directed RNA polymerase subunit M/transcription elongation factor TFIIS
LENLETRPTYSFISKMSIRSETLKTLRKVQPLGTPEERKAIEKRLFEASKNLSKPYESLVFEAIGAYEFLDPEDFGVFMSQIELGYEVRDTIVFEKPAADEFRIQESYFEEEKVVEGVRKCKKCGSKRLKIKIRQIRRGDEGPTEFATCADCGYG